MITCSINQWLTEGWWLETPNPMKGVIPIHAVTLYVAIDRTPVTLLFTSYIMIQHFTSKYMAIYGEMSFCGSYNEICRFWGSDPSPHQTTLHPYVFPCLFQCSICWSWDAARVSFDPGAWTQFLEKLITQEEYLMFHWDTKSYIEVTVQYISYYSINYIPLHSSMSLKKQVIIPQLPLQFSFWAPPLTVPTEVVGIVSPHLESTQFWWGHLLPARCIPLSYWFHVKPGSEYKTQRNLPHNHAPLSRHFPPLIAKGTSDGAWNSSARFMSPILNRYMCRVCPNIQIFDKFRETPNEDRSRHQATKGLKGFWVSIHPDLRETDCIRQAVLQPGSPEIWWHPNGKIMSKLVYVSWIK